MFMGSLQYPIFMYQCFGSLKVALPVYGSKLSSDTLTKIFVFNWREWKRLTTKQLNFSCNCLFYVTFPFFFFLWYTRDEWSIAGKSFEKVYYTICTWYFIKTIPNLRINTWWHKFISFIVRLLSGVGWKQWSLWTSLTICVNSLILL